MQKSLKQWKKVLETDLDHVCNDLADALGEQSVVFLEGELGAGKTTLVKNFIGKDRASSPTYSVINEYGSYLHADLYRVEDREELIHLELEEYLEGKEVFFVEWGEKYLSSIDKLIDEDFEFFMVKIAQSNKAELRDLELFSLSRD